MTLDVGFLRDLCLASGASGYEAPVGRLIAARIRHTMPRGEIASDTVGNFTVTLADEGVGGHRVLLAAHADQIGAVVSGADEHGFVWLQPSGLLDASLLPGHLVSVQTATGPLDAVVGRVPGDFLRDGDSAKLGFDDLWLDIGAKTQEEALSLVAIGDPVTFTPSFVRLARDGLASQALDDRAGVYAIFRGLELWSAGPHARDTESVTARGTGSDTQGQGGLHRGAPHVTAVATTGEETTFLGARALATSLRPDIIVVVDVIWASDHPHVDGRKLGGDIRLGAGPVLNRGAGLSERLVRLVRTAAERARIPLQLRAVPGSTLSDADELLATPGAETIAFGIPLRYMHAPCEVVDGNDVEHTAELIAAFLEVIAGS